jgi:hypothetical protein
MLGVTAQAGNFVLTTATCPVCSDGQLEAWRYTVDNTMGVAGKDPVGHQIGSYAAKRTGLGQNWYPADVFKRTLCGKFHHFNFFDGWYWWKEPWPLSWGGGDVVWMMVVQDDSNRFDRPGDYGGPSTKPSWWRPWSANPRTGELKIAFAGPPRRLPFIGPLNITINEAFSRNVVTAEDLNAHQDSDDGTEHAFEYNGNIVVQVREMQPQNNDVGVRFVDVCRRSNGSLQGYVALTSKVGRGDRGQEGYHVLYAHIARQSRLLPDVQVSELLESSLRRSSRGTVRAEGEEDSLRRVMVNGRPQLTMDVKVEPVSDARGRATEQPLTSIELIEGTTRTTLAHRLIRDSATNRSIATVTDLPILGGAKLAVSSGTESRELTFPPLELAPRRDTQRPGLGN